MSISYWILTGGSGKPRVAGHRAGEALPARAGGPETRRPGAPAPGPGRFTSLRGPDNLLTWRLGEGAFQKLAVLVMEVTCSGLSLASQLRLVRSMCVCEQSGKRQVALEEEWGDWLVSQRQAGSCAAECGGHVFERHSVCVSGCDKVSKIWWVNAFFNARWMLPSTTTSRPLKEATVCIQLFRTFPDQPSGTHSRIWGVRWILSR